MLTFTALADLPPHMTTRSRKQMGLDKEMTAEEMIQAFKDGTYWKPKYVAKNPRRAPVYPPPPCDWVDDEIWEEKKLTDFDASHSAGIPSVQQREDMLAEGEEYQLELSLAERLQMLQISMKRAICSDLRFTANMLNADPHSMIWNRIADTMPARQRINLIRECQEHTFPEAAWNLQMQALEPRQSSPFLKGNASHWDDPSRPVFTISSLKLMPRQLIFTAEQVEAWMELAENHRLPDRITRCQFSGDSLVETRVGRSRRWRIAPNWHGMSLKKAREAVSWAAIDAGIATGYQVGEPPAPVKALVRDGPAWAGLAVATRHPQFKEIARVLIMLQNLLYFKLDGSDIRANLAAWERVAASAQKEEANE